MTVDEETVPALLRARAKDSPDAVAFAYESNGGWKEIRWREFLQRVETLAAGLHARGLETGDHVGILAPTSLEWELIHHAVLAAGGVVVGMEPHDTAERLQYIAEHADLRVLAVGNPELLRKLSPEFLGALKLVVVFEDAQEQASANVVRLPELRDSATAEIAESPRISPKASATLIYTSGTTGQPKGILYRQEQVTLAVRAIVEAYPSLPVGSRFVSWLPLSNLFQRIMNLAALATGGTVFLVSNPLNVLKALPYARPDVFIGVPRFYEKLHAGMMERIGQKRFLVRRAIGLALDTAHRFARFRRNGDKAPAALRLSYRAIDNLFLYQLRKIMGGRIRFMVTGSAPIPVRLLEFFDAIGMPLYEAYGLSENVVPIALGRPGQSRFGAVGKPLPVNELRVADDGELLVRGPGVFSGYYKDAQSSPLFTPDGFYATGDYAEVEPDGMVRLCGRKSEVFKTSSGRRLSPVAVETLLEESPFVDRAVVIGSGRKCLIAAIALEPRHIPSAWNAMMTTVGADIPHGFADQLIRDLDARVSPLPEYSRPAGYLLLRRPLSVESGELTPNLKLRRKAFEERREKDISALYDSIEHSDDERPMLLGSL